jgi:hypothetical protein
MSPFQDLLADLERQLIAAYLAGAGYDLDVLEARTDDEARQRLAEASRYASARLSEIEARARYLHDLRGEG